MTDIDQLIIQMVQSRKAMFRNLDRALELVRAHYSSDYRGYDIRVNPNLTDWMIRHGGAVVDFAPTPDEAKRRIDRWIFEDHGRVRARAEGRERR